MYFKINENKIYFVRHNFSSGIDMGYVTGFIEIIRVLFTENKRQTDNICNLFLQVLVVHIQHSSSFVHFFSYPFYHLVIFFQTASCFCIPLNYSIWLFLSFLQQRQHRHSWVYHTRLFNSMSGKWDIRVTVSVWYAYSILWYCW